MRSTRGQVVRTGATKSRIPHRGTMSYDVSMCLRIRRRTSGHHVVTAALIQVIASAPPAAGVPDSDEHLRAPCEMTIEFSDPRDWRCAGAETEPCRVCRNTSDHASELHMRCVGETEGMRRSLPPGAELEICHGGSRRGV